MLLLALKALADGGMQSGPHLGELGLVGQVDPFTRAEVLRTRLLAVLIIAALQPSLQPRRPLTPAPWPLPHPRLSIAGSRRGPWPLRVGPWPLRVGRGPGCSPRGHWVLATALSWPLAPWPLAPRGHWVLAMALSSVPRVRRLGPRHPLAHCWLLMCAVEVVELLVARRLPPRCQHVCPTGATRRGGRRARWRRGWRTGGKEQPLPPWPLAPAG